MITSPNSELSNTLCKFIFFFYCLQEKIEGLKQRKKREELETTKSSNAKTPSNLNRRPKYIYGVLPFSSDENHKLTASTTIRRDAQAAPISTILLNRSAILDSLQTLSSDPLRNPKTSTVAVSDQDRSSPPHRSDHSQPFLPPSPPSKSVCTLLLF